MRGAVHYTANHTVIRMAAVDGALIALLLRHAFRQ
jgi:hypothetical protein